MSFRMGHGWGLRLLALAVLGLCLGAAQGQGVDLRKLATGGGIAPAEQQGDEQIVQARLVADRDALTLGQSAWGQPFRLGVHYTIQPGWHIYWRNSGDSGTPTTIDWHLPAGWQAGPLQWPAPHRFVTGDDVTYGYGGELLLYAWVFPPAGQPIDQPVTITADSFALSCKEICLPNDFKGLSLTLPPAAPAAAPGLPAPGSAGSASTPTGKDAELFRAADAAWGLGSQPAVVTRLEVAHTDGGAVLRAHVGSEQAGAIDLTRARADGENFNLFVALPDDFEATHAVLAGADAAGLIYDLPLKPRKQAKPGDYPLVGALRVPLTGGAPRAPGEEAHAVGAAVAPQFERLLQLGEDGRIDLSELPVPVQVAVPGTPLVAAGEAPSGPTPTGEVAGGPSITGAAAGVPSGGAPTTAPAAPPARLSFVNHVEAEQPLIHWLLLALLGGLILNIMPCVLPVVSLKVLGFVRQAGESRGRVLRLGLAYAAGVVASFWVLAALVVVLRPDGWGFLMQEPRFVIAMTALIFALGLSLFGVFSIELAGGAVNTLDAAARREGYGGAFGSGIVTTALATPCSAPFLGPALAFAFGQPGGVIFAVFTAIGLGLALPYVLLALKPGWLRFVPRPGLWMERFKQLMGFLMMGTVLWLLFVVSGLMDVGGLLLTLAFLLVLALAAWLFGLAQAARPGARAVLRVAALVLVGLGYWLAPERHLRQLDGPASAATASAGPAAPSAREALLATREAPGAGATRLPEHADGIDWEPFSVARVEELARAGELVFIDFTADWCTTCKFNEAGVLSSAAVREAFDRHKVRALKADWTRRDAQIAEVLKQFGARAVPLYVIIPPRRPAEAFTLPTLLKQGDVLDGLQRAAGLASQAGATVKKLAEGEG